MFCKCPGHPEVGITPGVGATTGPLGQGFANAVGLAMAETMQAARFNWPGHVIVDHMTYCLCSDGDLEEGLSSEAAGLAGNLKLGKLIVLYADNHIQIEGGTELADKEDRVKGFASQEWHVMPCIEVFAKQPQTYRDAVLSGGVPRLMIEAGLTLGWRSYFESVDACVGVDKFGASAPGETVMREYGLTVENVCQHAQRFLK